MSDVARYTFQDNSVEVLRKLGKAIDNAAQETKEMLVEAVQEKILYGYNDPHGKDGHTEIVDTGRLFDSINADVKRDSQNTVTVSVGSTGDTPYSIFVHQGTRKLKGRPFIRDAMEESRVKVRKIMENNIKNG